MKVAFVVGFFDPVVDAVEKAYADEIRRGSVVVLRQPGLHKQPLLCSQFKGKLLEAIRDNGAAEVLVLLAVLRKAEWVEQTVESIFDDVKRIRSGVVISLETSKDARAEGMVLERLESLGLRAAQNISRDLLAAKLTSKVFCLSRTGRTGFREALRRSGFDDGYFDEFFEEHAIDPGRNSNLIKLVKDRSRQHDHFLYAWSGGMRTLPADVKRMYKSSAHEGPDVAQVVALFKRWLLG